MPLAAGPAVTVITSWLTAISLIFAGFASADADQGPPNVGDSNVVVADDVPSGETPNPPPSQDPTELPSGPDPPTSEGPTNFPPPEGNDPDEDPGPGRFGFDKCRRREPWPLPLWCFGLDSWPVMKSYPPFAKVTGIRGSAADMRRDLLEKQRVLAQTNQQTVAISDLHAARSYRPVPLTAGPKVNAR